MKKLFCALLAAAALLFVCGVLCACAPRIREVVTHTHEWSAWEITSEPTCCQQGSRKRICTICGKEEGEVLPVSSDAHSMNGWEIEREATCSLEGIRFSTCEWCGERVEEPIAKKAHVPSTEFYYYNEAEHYHVCGACGVYYGTDEHVFDKNGYCTVCGMGKNWHADELSIVVGLETCGVRGIGTFRGADLEIPAHYYGRPVTIVSTGAFDNCEFLESVVIPSSVRTVYSAFNNCTNLKSVRILDGGEEETLLDGSFSGIFNGCYNLEEVVLSENTNQLTGVLFGDSHVKKLVLPDTLWRIEPSVLTRCTIDSIVFAGNGLFEMRGGCLIRKAERSVIYACTGADIPSGIVAIEDNAFRGHTNFIDLVIPDGITKIGYYAFAECENLRSVVISASVPLLADYVFAYCPDLETVTITAGESIEIEANVFLGCGALRSVSITGGEIDLGIWVFARCPSVERVEIIGENTILGNELFSGCDSLTYLRLTGVRKFSHLMFHGCDALQDIVLETPFTDADLVDFPYGADIWCNFTKEALDGVPGADAMIDRCSVHWLGEWEYIDGVPAVIAVSCIGALA